MWSRWIIMVLVVATVSACKTKKKIVLPSDATPTDVTAAHVSSIKSFEMSNLDFHSFTGRAKTKIEMGKSVQDVTLNVRIQRDKAIWISVTALLGVEAARVLITPDSIKVLNKLQGEYLAKPFDYVQRFTNKGVTFAMVQDLLMANVSSSLLRTNNVQVASAQDEFIVVGIKEDLSYQYRINKDNRPFNFLMERIGANQNLQAFYGDYTKTDGYNFPQRIALDMSGGDVALKAQLVFNKVAFNENIELPFTVSDRYKVID
ncbi:DUF4292 domain-containing protein [Sphingobacterium psychroaquaticum]|uniref:Uncharacterized protein n=1 Tax=Sphingobacterium psychroaquaticum TaxID=561061 RepID=A0A1X7L5K3_9SPHI|nr:DUF4292 domain-containing protein [Sphingobacterium psychroaquaticum]QBQ42292.1 DUF4292 domain-containing protein [Sphingobacterium psychroaquaticum]SMG48887.1 protein of unknown function [Sphingobacterium psychroaquaticum]